MALEIEPLPGLFAGWLGNAFGWVPAREVRASCERCPMCSPAAHAARPFNPATKCCTYVPDIPNFLAGRILRDGPPSGVGVGSLCARIAARSGVTPLFVGRSAYYAVVVEAAGGAGFGVAPALQCPHYDTEGAGSCSIWANRNSVCSTWFCKHVRGNVGRLMWESVRDMLGKLEADLTVWACERMGLGVGRIRRCLNHHASKASVRLAGELSGKWAGVYEDHWGEWCGREEEFYRGCAEVLDGVDWADIKRIAGPATLASIAAAEQAVREATAASWPDRVRLDEFVVRPMDGVALLLKDSPHDPVEVTWGVLHRLGLFAKSATGAELTGCGIADHDLARLLDLRVLVPVASDQVSDEVLPVHEATG